MSFETWTAVDDYFARHLIPADPELDAALAASDAEGLPSIAVSPPQGKFLYLLARFARASRILEIGTLGGYSTIWLGRALPHDGTLVTLEADPHHADVASENLARAGLSDVVEVHTGRALDTLPTLRGTAPFDLVFIDADKTGNADYVRWALELTTPGSVVVVDNVVRRGAVADPDSTDEAVRGVQRMTELVAAEPRLDATVLQTVGGKGYDGLLVALVN